MEWKSHVPKQVKRKQKPLWMFRSLKKKKPKQTLCLKCYTNVQTVSTSHTLGVMYDIGARLIQNREGRMQKEQWHRRTGVEEGEGEGKWENERKGGFYENSKQRR